MGIWKNKSVRVEVFTIVLLTLVTGAYAWYQEKDALKYVLFMGGAAFVICYTFEYRRMKQIAKLSYMIDKVLHGQDKILITDHEEGELSILASEIQKMTARLSEQADLLQKDKSKLTDAIADISHQMRTPLTTMNLVVSMLGQEDLSYEKRLSLTRDLKRQMERTHWLVEALLKISKIDAGTARFHLEEVKMEEIIKRCVEPFLVPMELRGQQLKIQVEKEMAKVDMAWTVEALSNLIKNCMEHTPMDGCIEVEVLETAIYTKVVIMDNGPGIEAADLPYIFDRFYKGKNATKESIGIGLALSRMIILAQNGTIQVSNRREGGARFEVKFYKGIV